ncbi:lipid-A-disaccharide synthase [Tateyamaria sp. ANG-S1]|uniref:lipid-A-disaccharide synthase n=1 Tax=Tateyamaria sp. ANG-S1 TaxID=1577905 RepID=UPI00057E424C|nr:lipid-A-disaccharide synthase [Tateyamaria sp. ANG-S1]KIC48959.1 lipid-A-disaccharide synthase [Tateyamaria sp. ANG-S1]
MGALRVFVVAGEPSGDALGGALLAGLKKEAREVSFDGIGGPLMQAQGLVSRFDMSELSVMGIAEVLPKYRHLKRRIAETAQAVIDQKPDVLITIDSPDFSLRVAKLVKAASDIRTVHYVAPTVWAWRPGRAKKMAAMIDHVLALFPFEPPFMEAEGMACDFVGHPAATVPRASVAEVAAFKARHELRDADPLLLVLPGSRRGEIKRMAPTFGAALWQLAQDRPKIKLVLPAAGAVAPLVRDAVSQWPVQPLVLDPTGQDPDAAATEKRIAFAAADVALATSGTVSLELAAAGTPMVSAYDLHWLSRAIISRMVTTDTGSLINHVSETRVVPEVVGKDFSVDNVVRAMEGLLADPSAQRDAMELTMDLLGRGGADPGVRAARAILMRLG